jgi:hypothetical protein
VNIGIWTLDTDYQEPDADHVEDAQSTITMWLYKQACKLVDDSIFSYIDFLRFIHVLNGITYILPIRCTLSTNEYASNLNYIDLEQSETKTIDYSDIGSLVHLDFNHLIVEELAYDRIEHGPTMHGGYYA